MEGTAYEMNGNAVEKNWVLFLKGSYDPWLLNHRSGKEELILPLV